MSPPPSDHPAARFLALQGHLPVVEVLALNGSLTLPDGSDGPAHLVRTPTGAWVVAAREGVGRCVDLMSAHPLRYEVRLLGDRLTVGSLPFGIPLNQGQRVQRALALARLGHRLGAPQAEPRGWGGPWCAQPEAHHRAAILGLLDPDETVLAWLETATEAHFEGGPLPGQHGEWWGLVTDRRQWLLAVSPVGDLQLAPLPDRDWTVGPSSNPTHLGRVELQAGDRLWLSTRTNRGPWEAVSGILEATGPDRVHQAARRLAVQRGQGAAHAAELLGPIATPDRPMSRLSWAMLAAPAGGPGAVPGEALASLRAAEADGEALARWAQAWSPPLPFAEALLAACQSKEDTPEAAAWSLPLHRFVHSRRLEAAGKDPRLQAQADIALAEHLLFTGALPETANLLEPRLARLPDEALHEVLPPPGTDLCAEGGGAPLHVRVLELLSQAHARAPAAHQATCLALAQHQPLRLGRLQAAAGPAEGIAADRARSAMACLAAGGLNARPESTPPQPLEDALAGPELAALRHPVARSAGVLGALQSALAHVPPPDLGVLRAYCDRAHPDRHPALVSAISNAAVAMGLAAPAAFITAGERKVGFRSHEEPEPFLLVGGAHLDPDSPFFLGPAELRFAVAAELAHLAFGHSRITSADVWAGVWDKGTTALELTASVVPLVRHLPAGWLARAGAASAIQTLVPAGWIGQLYGSVDAAQLTAAVAEDVGKASGAGASVAAKASSAADTVRAVAHRVTGQAAPEVAPQIDVGADADRLLAAHRVMQLTADRVGLVAAGDLGASLRAIHLLHTRLEPELGVAQQIGLRAALGRRQPDGTLMFEHLQTRVAALVAFWLHPQASAPWGR